MFYFYHIIGSLFILSRVSLHYSVLEMSRNYLTLGLSPSPQLALSLK